MFCLKGAVPPSPPPLRMRFRAASLSDELVTHSLFARFRRLTSLTCVSAGPIFWYRLYETTILPLPPCLVARSAVVPVAFLSTVLARILPWTISFAFCSSHLFFFWPFNFLGPWHVLRSRTPSPSSSRALLARISLCYSSSFCRVSLFVFSFLKKTRLLPGEADKQAPLPFFDPR